MLFLPHLPFVSFSRFSGFGVLQSLPRACSKCWFPWTHHRSPAESKLGGGPRNLHFEDTPQAVVRLGVFRLCRPTLTSTTLSVPVPTSCHQKGRPWCRSGAGLPQALDFSVYVRADEVSGTAFTPSHKHLPVRFPDAFLLHLTSRKKFFV